MVMGGDLCSRGRVFESQHWMDSFSQLFAKIICLKIPKINEKETGKGQCKKTFG